MPADKVAVTTEQYQQLMADQVSGMLIRPGAGNAPESASQNLSAASRFGNVSFGTVTATGLDLNGNADISGTLVVGGVTTLKGALAAQAGITTTTITATGTTTLAALNATNITASGTLKVNGQSTLAAVSATNISASGTLTVNGNSTLKALSATNISASGTVKVTGATTLTGKLTANGGVDTKAITATTLTTSGNATIGGLLAVTGDVRASSNIDTRNGYGRGLRLIDTALDALELPSDQRQDWAVRVLDRDERTMATLKYNKGTAGETSWILAEVTYTSEGTQDWAQLQIGHRADGTRFIDAQAPFRASSTANFLNGLTVSGAKAIFNHDIDANGALNVTKTLTAKGALSVTGAATFSNTVTASKAIRSTDSLSAPMLYLGGTGAHIVRQLTNITKGTAPSSTVYVGNFLYPSGSTNAVSNRIAGNEIAIGTGGITTYTFTCYENAASSTNAASLRLGYAGEPYINLSADNINVGGMLNASEGITSAKGIAVQTGNISCASGTFVGNSTVNFAHIDTVIVNGQAPSGEQQRWPLAVYDKNNDALAYCKFTMRTTGTKEWAFCIAHPKSDDSGNALGGLIVTCDANGKYGTTGVTADASSNSTDLATTFWVRRYIWDADESKLVHTVNDETIAGTKTFTYAISCSATTLIQSVPWDGISIADTSRESAKNRMLCVVLDKDAKRFAGIEVSATTSGQRYVHITMRRRDDSGWVSPFKATELPDGTTYCEGSHHPPADDDSMKFATTGWVNDHLSAAIPVGAVMYFAQGAVPEGWLFCNGSAVSRTTYAALYAAIGTKYGSGNGSSTFTLPNLRSIFVQGASSTSDVGTTVAAGLPNITGTATGYEWGRSGGLFGGAFYDGHTNDPYNIGTDSGASAHDNTAMKLGIDASRVSSVYGNSNTVQPPAVRLLPCIKF